MAALQEKISEKISNRKKEKEKLSKRKKKRRAKEKRLVGQKKIMALPDKSTEKLWNWPTSQLQSKSGDKNHKKF